LGVVEKGRKKTVPRHRQAVDLIPDEMGKGKKKGWREKSYGKESSST